MFLRSSVQLDYNRFEDKIVRYFYINGGTYNATAIPVDTDMKSESESRQCCLEVVGVVDEKCRIVDVVFLVKFTQKQERQPVFVVENSRMCRRLLILDR